MSQKSKLSKWIKIVFKCISALVICLLFFCILRVFILFPQPNQPVACDDQPNHQAITIDQPIVDRFRKALTFKTISWSIGNYNGDELVRFRSFIQQSNIIVH